MSENTTESLNFIEKIIKTDSENGVSIVTRFPPEPNGYLHLGHVKSIVLNFSMAQKYHGKCNLRFDDTNPEKEKGDYIRSIEEDVHWLGFDYGNAKYASDYYQTMYESAIKLIKEGKAYVDSMSAEEIKNTRGTLTEPGILSPARNKSVEQNLAEFEEMKNGKYEEGERVLRAKIDMAASNINMRDPVIYRIRKTPHPRTGDKWCIYPMYDFAHSIEDSMEGITHSLCTLEFEDHRPLYDWVVDNDTVEHKPRQIEFSRLNVNYTLMSKRKLLYLVENGYVEGWDDPRLPTIAGLRRRGFTPDALKNFVNMVGISKVESTVDYSLLEFALREDLNKKALRLFAVFDPIKVVIDNYPEGQSEDIELINNPENPNSGKRTIKFAKEIYIERSDFMLEPPKGFFRLAIGSEVRLKGAYFIKATSVEKDENGNVTLIHATYDPQSKGGESPDGRKVKGTIHFLSTLDAKNATACMYDKLFTSPNPGEQTGNYLDDINPNSLVVKDIFVEPAALNCKAGDSIQFIRNGYFTPDSHYHSANKPVFNLSVGLKDSWAKECKKNNTQSKPSYNSATTQSKNIAQPEKKIEKLPESHKTEVFENSENEKTKKSKFKEKLSLLKKIFSSSIVFFALFLPSCSTSKYQNLKIDQASAIELASIYRNKGDRQSEKQILEEFVKEYGYLSNDINYNLALVYLENKDYDSVVKVCQANNKKFGNSLDFDKILAYAYEKSNNETQADELYKKIISNKNSNTDDILSYIKFLKSTNRQKEARDVLKSSIEEKHIFNKEILKEAIELDSENTEYKILFENLL